MAQRKRSARKETRGAVSPANQRENAKAVSAAFEAGFTKAAAEAFKCLALCYDLEISLKDAKIDIIDVTGSTLPGIKTIAEEVIKALVNSKFTTKKFSNECKAGCDCLRIFEGETDWTLPGLEKTKTFSKTVLGVKISFSVHFVVKITLHVKGHVGICIDEVI